MSPKGHLLGVNLGVPEGGSVTAPNTREEKKMLKGRVGKQSEPEQTPSHDQNRRRQPESSPLPTMGLPALILQFYQLLGIKKIPRLSTAEQTKLKTARLNEQICTRADWLRRVLNAQRTADGKMSWEALKATIAFFNEKGGSAKSTIAVAVANLVAKETNALVLIVPAASNGGSTTGRASVRQQDTLGLVEIELLLRELTNNGAIKADPQVVRSKLRRNEYGTYVLAQRQLPTDFGESRLKWVLDQLEPMFDLVILDTGNNIPRPGIDEHDGNVEFEVARRTHAVGFVATPETPDSLYGLGDTMDAMVCYPHKGKFQRAVCVISGVKPRDNTDFERYALSKVEQTTGVSIRPRKFSFKLSDNVADGCLVVLPWDQHLKETSSVKLEDLDRVPYAVVAELAVQLLTRAAVEQGINLSVLEAIEEADRTTFDYTEWSKAHNARASSADTSSIL